MTTTLTWAAIQELIGHSDETCLTVLMPTSPHELPLADQNQLRHLLHRAEVLLINQGFEADAARHFLESANQLPQCEEFWRNRRHGLALFAAPNFLRWYFVEAALPEFVLLSSHFYIKPLVPLAQHHCHFYILALDPAHATLRHYDAVSETVQPVSLMQGQGSEALPGLPDDEDVDTGERKQKSQIEDYFRQLSRRVDEQLHDSRAPLILAGPSDLQSLYRQVNHYPHLLDAAMTGNPDAWGESQFVSQARPIVASMYDENVKRALGDFTAVNNTPRVTSAFKDIVRAAGAGRVDTLFVAQDAERWGVFDAETQRVQAHIEPKVTDESLLNLALVNTLLHRGQVFVLPRARVPHKGIMAAELRY